MIRVNVYRNFNNKDGRLVVVEDSIETFKCNLASQFKLHEENIKLFSSNGCEINDLRVVRDNENLYLTLENVEDKNCDNESLMANLSVCAKEENNSKTLSDWITLNVGGKHFTTTRSTIVAKEPHSMLARMFADEDNTYLMTPSATDSIGAYLIDRSPEYFEPILNYLRHGNVILDKSVNPKGVLEEAVFYGM
jgi:BTB/POZ domain-containing protein KCTD9